MIEASSASNIILHLVCPLFGVVATNIKYSAPFKDVRRAEGLGTLGALNPTPWAAMTGNCIGWVAYSYVIKSPFVFWANAPGLIFSLWLNMVATKLQYCDRMTSSIRSSFVELLDRNQSSFVKSKNMQIIQPSKDFDELEAGKVREVYDPETLEKPEKPETNDSSDAQQFEQFANLKQMALDIIIQKTEAPAIHEKVVLAVVSFWVAVISVVCFFDFSHDQREFIVGIAANVNLIFFYAAPLSRVYAVIKTRDSSSIHRWTVALNTANAAFWTAFAIGVKNYYIMLPQGTGLVLGLIQILLCVVFPRREKGIPAVSSMATIPATPSTPSLASSEGSVGSGTEFELEDAENAEKVGVDIERAESPATAASEESEPSAVPINTVEIVVETSQ